MALLVRRPSVPLSGTILAGEPLGSQLGNGLHFKEKTGSCIFSEYDSKFGHGLPIREHTFICCDNEFCNNYMFCERKSSLVYAYQLRENDISASCNLYSEKL